MKNNYYYAKIRRSYLNYINLFSEIPIRLKNTNCEKESIIYTSNDIKRIIMLHPKAKIEIEKK